ncbi:MAG: restriction endonuclease [Methanothrix sp.]|uniref:restriction endonuclease n=1 Tax=Methanothrix sp. TaxID=90426 RepID=UPI00316AE9F1
MWQNFERLVGHIFEQNDFSVEVNIVRTLQRERRQYDIIACRAGRTVLVECKRWSGHRPRLSALKRAIKQHKERCAFYQTLTGREAVAVVVTLIEEEIKTYEGVPVVPVLKLNSFIAEMENGTYG